MQDLIHLKSTDRWCAVTTFGFDIAFLEWLMPLLIGAAVILPDSTSVADPRRLLNTMLSCEATVLQATPGIWRGLLEAGKLPTTVRLALCGGDVLSPQLAVSFSEHSQAELWNLYGPTETTIWATAYRLDRWSDATPPPIGYPLKGTTVHVLDDNLCPIYSDTPGQLYIGGACVARGYWNAPDLTAARFIDSKFHESPGKLYRTGDMAKWNPDGSLQFLGRIDRQIKIRGYRVELDEIEIALRGAPGVVDAAVVARPSPSGDLVLLGYIVRDDHIPLPDLSSYLRVQLPGYMVPNIFTVVSSIPLTAHGKIDRHALPEPTPLREPALSEYVPPCSELERAVCSIWQDALDVERVGMTDDFFELGGHSLLATLIALRISRVTGIAITVADLLAHSTIAELMTVLTQHKPIRIS
jgi:acyl-coenzyme A synthetase/AMP-(fatty) acid ligase